MDTTLLDRLIEKWQDVNDTAEDLASDVLSAEILDDLKELRRG